MAQLSKRTRSGTGSSKRRGLAEVARLVVVPDGIVSTQWPSVERTLRNLGLFFDPWQQDLGKLCVAKRADGQYAATVGGIVVSIPRQVGKTFTVGGIVFALCLLRPGIKVVWTAHHLNTTDETFEDMAAMARLGKIAPHIAPRGVRSGNGKQRIRFRNKSQIEFGARESGFGRGKKELSILILDEFQHVSEAALENLVPTMNQGKDPLMFAMGTPPRPIDRGEAFTNRRRRAWAGESKDMVYVEIGADPEANVDDRKQWAKANPSYPHRTPEAAFMRMRENLATEDSFRREALGIWDEDTGAPPLISPGRWAELVTGDVPTGDASFGIKFSASGDWVSVCMALRLPDGSFYVEPIDSRSLAEGHGFLVDLMVSEWRDSVAVVFDGRSDAPVFYQALRAQRVPDRVLNLGKKLLPTGDYAAAVSGMVELVRTGAVSHPGDPVLDDSLRGSGRRDISKSLGTYGFGPLFEGADSTMADAAALALYGAVNGKSRSGGQRMVIR